MQEFEQTFDHAVWDYDKSRPLYAKELYDDIFEYQPIDAESAVLEIGIGTGKATLPFLEKGCHLTAIEPGGQLAGFSRARFCGYHNFVLHNMTLQEYECPEEAFDMIYAATAFHWIPEEYGYRRVRELLKQDGAFARFAYHAGEDKKREILTQEIQAMYARYAGWKRTPKEYGQENARELAEVAYKYGFGDIEYKLYHWTKDFSADKYMGLLRTYPDHMAIDSVSRKKLFDGIHSAIEKSGGTITVYYTADLQLARKG